MAGGRHVDDRADGRGARLQRRGPREAREHALALLVPPLEHVLERHAVQHDRPRVRRGPDPVEARELDHVNVADQPQIGERQQEAAADHARRHAPLGHGHERVLAARLQ
jgi:hypothetical protein